MGGRDRANIEVNCPDSFVRFQALRLAELLLTMADPLRTIIGQSSLFTVKFSYQSHGLSS